VQSALTVAETGHLVLSTLHTNSAVQTINRIIDIFPSSSSRKCAPSCR
jgi:twitching motility protein PilT